MSQNRYLEALGQIDNANALAAAALDIDPADLRPLKRKIAELSTKVTRIESDFEETNESIKEIKDVTVKRDNFMNSVDDTISKMRAKSIDATDYYSYSQGHNPAASLPNFASEHGFIVAPDGYFQATYSQTESISIPNNTAYSSSIGWNKAKWNIAKWRISSTSKDETRTVFFEKTKSTDQDTLKISILEGTFSLMHDKKVLAEIDYDVKDWNGFSFSVDVESHKMVINHTRFTPKADAETLKFSCAVERKTHQLDQDTHFFPSRVANTVSDINAHDCLSFSSHRYTIIDFKDKLVGRETCRGWEAQMVESMNIEQKHKFSEIAGDIINELYSTSESNYTEVITLLSRGLATLYDIVPSVRPYSINFNREDEPMPIRAAYGSLRYEVKFGFESNASGSTIADFAEPFIQEVKEDLISVNDAGVQIRITPWDNGTTKYGTTGRIKWYRTNTAPVDFSVDLALNEEPVVLNWTTGIKIELFVNSWPGTSAEAIDLNLYMIVDGKVKKYLLNPEITVDTSGKVTFTDSISIDTIQMIDLPGGAYNFKDQWSGDASGTRYSESTAFSFLNIVMDSKFYRTYTFYNFQTADPALIIPDVPLYYLMKIEGMVKVMQSPLNGGITLVDPQNALLEEKINSLTSAVATNTKALWDLESRMDVMEQMMKGSAFNTIGDIFVSFSGAIPGIGGIVAPIVAGATMYIAGSIVNHDPSGLYQAAAAIGMGSVGAIWLARGSISAKATKWMESLKEIAEDLKVPISKAKKRLKNMRVTLRTYQNRPKFDPNNLFSRGRDSFETPFEHLINLNYVSVAHAKLSFVPFDASGLVNNSSFAGTMYRSAHKRGLTPTHSELRTNMNYFVEEFGDEFDFNISQQFGVGTGIGTDLKMSERMKTLGIGNGSDGNNALGIKTIFQKVNTTTGEAELYRFPLDSDKKLLIKEAKYYNRTLHGQSWSKAKEEEWLLTEPWLNDNHTYNEAYALLKEDLANVGMRMDAKQTSFLSASPLQLQALNKAVGEDYMKDSFIYDVLNNNCHQFANSMYKFITKQETPGYVLDSYANTWFKDMSKKWSSLEGVHGMTDYTDLDDIHSLMDTFFDTVANAEPRRLPLEELFE